MRAVSAGWVTYNASAARLTLPVRATSMNAWTWPKSIVRYQSHLCSEPAVYVLLVFGVRGQGVGGGFVGNQALVDAARLLHADLQLAREVARRDLAIVVVQNLARLGQQTFFGVLLARQLLQFGFVRRGVLRVALQAPEAAHGFDLVV